MRGVEFLIEWGLFACALLSIWSPATVLLIQIFNWVSRPQVEFHANAGAGILVLLALLLSMNAAAIWLRDRYQKRGLS